MPQCGGRPEGFALLRQQNLGKPPVWVKNGAMPLRMTWTQAAAQGLVKGPAPKATTPASQQLKKLRKSPNGPEQWLFEAVKARYPQAQSQYRCLPPRRFTLDVALPELKIAIEADGWAFHGKHRGDFHRDREKRNLLELDGWTVLAFSARDIKRDLPALMVQVDTAVRNRLTQHPWTHKGDVE